MIEPHHLPIYCTHNQHVHVVSVAGVPEPAEGTDVVPAVDPGGEVTPAEHTQSARRTGSTVEVEVCSPVEESLKCLGETGGEERRDLRRTRTGWRRRWRPRW